MLFAFAAVVSLTACMIDDPPPCTIQDSVAPDDVCSDSSGSNPFSFKLEYTTANGTRPDGRYNYSESAGLTSSQAELETKVVLQNVFNTSSAYVALEVNEISYYRGNICGLGYHLKSGVGQITVKRVRKAGVHRYDYDLELTCVED